MGIATIDTHIENTKKKEKARLSYSKWTHKAALWVKFSNVNRTSELWSRDRGVWSNPHNLLQPSDSWWWITIVSMTCNVELRSQETKLKLLTILKTRLRAYAVSLPRYAYTVLTCDRLIDDSTHCFEPVISRCLSHHTFHLVSWDAPLIVLLLLLYQHVYCSRPAVFNIAVTSAIWL